MTGFKKTLMAMGFVLSGASVNAEVIVDQTQQKDLSMTLYQNGLGFVQDVRSVDVQAGVKDYVFEDISARLIPDSLLMSAPGIAVKERQFAFDLITPQVLLNHVIGQNVTFRKFNSVTGKDDLIKAKVLSTQGGVVVERDGRIEVGLPGQLVLDNLPVGLKAKPSLMARLDAVKNEQTNLALAYLSDGLSWKVSYSAEIDEDAKSVRLHPWASLTNTSGTDYKDMTVNLAAGSVNRRSRPQPVAAPKMMRAAAVAMDGVAEAAAAPPQAIGGVHIYPLKEKVSLANNVTKQVSLMSPVQAQVERRLVQRYGPVYGALNNDPNMAQHPVIELKFKNESGLPLPQGKVRLYRKDAQGGLFFVGEDNIRDTPVDEEAQLNPGKSFDVTIRRSQTAFKQYARNHFMASYRVVIKNAKKTMETIRLEQQFPNGWTLHDTSHEVKSTSGSSAIWSVQVPAGQDVSLTYRVEVKNR